MTHEKKEDPSTETRSLAEVLKTLIAFMDRDYVVRKAHLEHQCEDLKQRKRKTIFFGLLIGGAVILNILMIVGVISEKTIGGDYVAVVRIEGEIMPNQQAAAKNLLPALKEAFTDKKAKGVILVINSPGGTPVQASLIHDAVVRLRQEYPDKKVIAVGEDFLTSGAYWIASSAPEIYVNESTVTGSIGVIASGFGVDMTKLKRYGLERRVTTAGDMKNRNDMFSPQRPEDIKKTKSVVEYMHAHFINAILAARKGKITGDQKRLFSGDYWTGKQAVQMGLADGLSDLPTIMREKFNVQTAADYTPRTSFIENVKRSFGVEGILDALVSKLSSGAAGPAYLAM